MYVEDEAKKYIEQIASTLEILARNLIIEIGSIKDEEEVLKSTEDKIRQYAHGIYKLAHLNIFIGYSILNKCEILSSLVEVMPLVSQRDTVYVDLSTEG